MNTEKKLSKDEKLRKFCLSEAVKIHQTTDGKVFYSDNPSVMAEKMKKYILTGETY